MMFDQFVPTKIVFGRGRLKELGVLAAAIGKTALIVCGRRSVQASGLLETMRVGLASQGIAVHTFEAISPNPRSDEVDAAAAAARRHSCDMIIGVGGGSAIDAAKAAAVSIDCGGVGELIGGAVPVHLRALPVIAVPTTAGTGAEVTKGAIIKDVARGFRSGVRGDKVFPAVALIDPELSERMPKEIARATAFDALTHAIESYLSRSATPVTDILAERAIHLFAGCCGRLADGTNDAADHDAMCLAALFGGIIVANAGTCLPHRLQQAMGSIGRVEASHAQGLAAVYPTWLRHVRPFANDRVDRIGLYLGFRPKAFPEDMSGLIERLGLNPRLGKLGYTLGDVDVVLGAISGNLKNDPIDGIGPNLIRSIYQEAL
jgi:alcohol dehydrogenase class IV